MLHIVVMIVGIGAIAYGIATVVTAFTICRPIAFNWDKTIVGGTCGNIPQYYLSTGIVNLLLDVFVVVLPMPMLWGLQMKLSRKVGLTFIFGLGFL